MEDVDKKIIEFLKVGIPVYSWPDLPPEVLEKPSNHEFAINNDELRSLAREAWSLMANFSNLTLTWVPRSKNLAGKMLGS